VLLSGLRDRERLLPYVVIIEDPRGDRFRVGTVPTVDTSGGATVAKMTARDLSGFLHVSVRDGRGLTVLSGDLDVEMPFNSPAP
jgi:hypothetical protein